MTPAARLVRFALPIGLLCFCWLSMNTEVHSGGESLTSFGFPVAWYARSPVSSMAYDIALGPLVVDLACYVAAAQLFLTLGQQRPPGAVRARPSIPLLLWTLAGISLVFTLSAISLDPTLVAWQLDSYFSPDLPRLHSFQFGPGH